MMKWDNQCYFAIDNRASFTFENYVECLYLLCSRTQGRYDDEESCGRPLSVLNSVLVGSGCKAHPLFEFLMSQHKPDPFHPSPLCSRRDLAEGHAVDGALSGITCVCK
ncbi:hypothetical protein CWB98_00690 [Pseudoalteromonas rubra]|uniref:Uncharacterized protein n=1 Tax=Pseudoalteromonas rubra TaxID=43658 RepID=A0A5S3X720_9GAMM|nr:hypothetical protein CWB98_00690 [Pseudoalteromonas rubra]